MPEIREKCDPRRKLEEGNDKYESPRKLQKVCKYVTRYHLKYGTQSAAHDTKHAETMISITDKYGLSTTTLCCIIRHVKSMYVWANGAH